MLFLQKRRYSLNSLSTDNFEKRLIETQSIDFSTSDSFTAFKTIVIGSEHSLKMNADVAETSDALNQFALMKLSIRTHCNKQAKYKTSTDEVVSLSERDVAETSKIE